MMKYEYGFEYPCNGVKPDLPDDVLVDSIKLNAEATAKLDELIENPPEPTDELRELMINEHYKPKSDWFERGVLPPVGEVVEYDTTFFNEVSELNKGKCKILGHNRDRVWVEYKDKPNSDAVINIAVIKFKPLRTKRDETIAAAEATIEEKQCLPANSLHLEILYYAGMLTKPTR